MSNIDIITRYVPYFEEFVGGCWLDRVFVHLDFELAINLVVFVHNQVHDSIRIWVLRKEQNTKTYSDTIAAQCTLHTSSLPMSPALAR